MHISRCSSPLLASVLGECHGGAVCRGAYRQGAYLCGVIWWGCLLRLVGLFIRIVRVIRNTFFLLLLSAHVRTHNRTHSFTHAHTTVMNNLINKGSWCTCVHECICDSNGSGVTCLYSRCGPNEPNNPNSLDNVLVALLRAMRILSRVLNHPY